MPDEMTNEELRAKLQELSRPLVKAETRDGVGPANPAAIMIKITHGTRQNSRPSLVGSGKRAFDLTLFRELLEDYWNGQASLLDTRSALDAGLYELETQQKTFCNSIQNTVWKEDTLHACGWLRTRIGLVFSCARVAKDTNPAADYANSETFRQWFDYLDAECEMIYWHSRGKFEGPKIKNMLTMIPNLRLNFPGNSTKLPFSFWD